MPYKFDLDEFDKKLLEKLNSKPASLTSRLREAIRRRKPKLPKM